MKKDIGNIIIELRRKNNLTQKELGNKLNVSDKCISKWENNITMPNLSILIDLADLFDISIDELIGIKKVQRNNKIKKGVLCIFNVLVFLTSLSFFVITNINSNKYKYYSIVSSDKSIKTVGHLVYSKDKNVLSIGRIEYDGKYKDETINKISLYLKYKEKLLFLSNNDFNNNKSLMKLEEILNVSNINISDKKNDEFKMLDNIDLNEISLIIIFTNEQLKTNEIVLPLIFA